MLCLVRSCPSLFLPVIVLLLLLVMILFIYGVLGSLQVLLGEYFCFFASSKLAKSSLLLFMGTTMEFFFGITLKNVTSLMKLG